MSAFQPSHPRPSRGRSRFPLPWLPPAPSSDPFFAPKKGRLAPASALHPALPRQHVPLSALVSAVALACFVSALVLSRRFGQVVVDSSIPPHPLAHPDRLPFLSHSDRLTPHPDPVHAGALALQLNHHPADHNQHRQHQSDHSQPSPDDPQRLLQPNHPPIRDTDADPVVPIGMGVDDHSKDISVPHNVAPEPDAHSTTPSDRKPVKEPREEKTPNPPPEKSTVEQDVHGDNVSVDTSSTDGRVGWDRSWPASPALDDSGLYRLSRKLNFSNQTMLNYFHMHKTGGVTTKVELMYLLRRQENAAKMTKRGERMQCVETCYELDETPPGKDDKSIEHLWRCDFGRILNMTQKERASVDVMMGHQYWENGSDSIFGGKRTVKHFSFFRHPLPRKLSFFYHFFVRNIGRDEKKVEKDEVIDFLLGSSLPKDPRTRDAGPNYYASRMLSDGTSGFGDDHRFDIPREKQDGAIAQVVDRLDHRFAFVGLQLHPEASQCMLQKAMQVLVHEHGIDDMIGTPKLAESTRRLNSGGYSWTATKIWNAMDERQKELYKQVEKVDLAIYDRVLKRFKDDVEMFSCADKVNAENFAEDVFE